MRQPHDVLKPIADCKPRVTATGGRSYDPAPPAGPSLTPYGKGGIGGNLIRKNWDGNVVGGI